MIFDMLRHIKMEIEHDSKTNNINAHNASVTDYNEGIRLLNNFIRFRNKHFIPEKMDSEIQSMIDSVDYKLKESKRKLNGIINPDSAVAEMISQLNKSIDDVSIQAKEQQDWLKLYLCKGKVGRKLLFYDKITLFGVPVK